VTIPQQSKIAALVALGVGTLATIAALAYAGRSLSALLSGFTIWALCPYPVLFASSRFAATRGRALTVCIVSLLASAFAVFVYWNALFVHTSSTSALVFVFVPLYQLIAAVILVAALFFSRRSRAAGST